MYAEQSKAGNFFELKKQKIVKHERKIYQVKSLEKYKY